MPLQHSHQAQPNDGGLSELASSSDLGWSRAANVKSSGSGDPHTDSAGDDERHDYADSSIPHPSRSDTNQLMPVRSGLDALHDQVAAMAKAVIHEYFAWWGEERLFRLKTKAPTEDHSQAQTGRLSPRIYAKTKDQGAKLYIEWGDHRSPKVKSLNPSWSKPVRPTARGYTEEQLRRLADPWEADRVVETEARLAVLRTTLDALHAARVTISRAVRYAK